MSDRQAKAQEIIDRINKSIASDGSAVGARLSGTRAKLKRIRSGILSLDIALGGGLPRGGMSLVYGPESSGKTTVALQVCAGLSRTCHNCKEDLMDCDCGNFEQGLALIIDAEGTYDPHWAEINGINPANVIIVVPESGEQAYEIAETAVRDNMADVIIIDCIEHCQSMKELEAGIAKDLISPSAKLANKFFRKITQALRSAKNPPHLYCINQMREKVGVMYGDNTVLPCGKGQHFAASVKVALRTSKVHPIKGGPNEAFVEIHGTVPKNKTATPKKAFKFHLNLVDVDASNKAGQVNNVEQIIALGRKCGFIKNITSGKEKGTWYFELEDGSGGTERFSGIGKDGLADVIKSDDDLYTVLYDYILEEALNGNC